MIDTLGDFELALNNMLADLPPPHPQHRVDRPTIERMLGKGSEHLIRNVLSLVAVAAATPRPSAEQQEWLHQQAWTSYQRHYLACNGDNAEVYPGVLAGLQQLTDDGLKLACVTNKPTAFTLPLLKAKGLDCFFELVFGGDAFERKKPDPLPLLKTCEALLWLQPRRTGARCRYRRLCRFIAKPGSGRLNLSRWSVCLAISTTCLTIFRS